MSAPVQVSSMFRRIGVKVALRSGWIPSARLRTSARSSRWATDLTIRREHRRHFCPIAFRPVTVLLVFIAAMIGLAACSGGGAQQSVKLELAPVSVLPPDIQQAEPKVREAYQFAVANQDYLTNFPCYCGCGGMGHQNNRDCYIDEVKADGTIVFEKHAFF